MIYQKTVISLNKFLKIKQFLNWIPSCYYQISNINPIKYKIKTLKSRDVIKLLTMLINYLHSYVTKRLNSNKLL